MSKFPDGKLDKTDEGDLKIAVFLKNGRVVLDFGKDLSWIGFDKKALRAVIDMLEVYYKKI